MKVNKTCHTTDDTIKKNNFLNNIWSKLCQSSSKFNFVLTILKSYKDKIMLFILYFSEMLIFAKRVNYYLLVFLMLVTSQFKLFLENCLRFNISIWYNECWLSFCRRLSKLSILNVLLWYVMISICNINNKKKLSWIIKIFIQNNSCIKRS